MEALLKADYSPEQIVGTLKKQNKEFISVERIYQHVWADKKQKGELFEHHRKKGDTIENEGIQKIIAVS